MHHRPFLHQIESTGWQFTLDYPKGFDVNRCFEVAVSCVKMRRRVVVVIHADQDPVEGANCWHLGAETYLYVTPLDPFAYGSSARITRYLEVGPKTRFGEVPALPI
jgi:hypothetical protein